MSRRVKSTVRANQALQPVIDWCERHYGFKAALVRRYAEKTSSCSQRALVQQWVHPDPKRRVEPKLGAGLLLLEAFRELVEELKKRQQVLRSLDDYIGARERKEP